MELAFTERTMVTRGEEYKVPLSFHQAKDGCDAFGKEIYARAFLWLVREINSATSAEENYEGGGRSENLYRSAQTSPNVVVQLSRRIRAVVVPRPYAIGKRRRMAQLHLNEQTYLISIAPRLRITKQG